MASRRMKKELAKFYKAKMLNKGSKKDMSKLQLAIALSALCDSKMTDMLKVLKALEEIALKEVESEGQFTIPEIVMIGAKAKTQAKRQAKRHDKAFAIW